ATVAIENAVARSRHEPYLAQPSEASRVTVAGRVIGKPSGGLHLNHTRLCVRWAGQHREDGRANRLIQWISQRRLKVDLTIEIVLLDIGEQQSDPAPARTGLSRNIRAGRLPNISRRETIVITMVIVKGNNNLMQIIPALNAIS